MRSHQRLGLAAGLLLASVLLASAAALAQENLLQSFGSGFIVDQNGYILTNEHVVHRAKTVNVVLREKDTFPATVLSVDAENDLALLKIETDEHLTSVRLGSSAEVKRQQSVLAMGFPFGEDAISSTSGSIVSVRKDAAKQLIVTDVLANPGNSGGPLLNDRGEAIGVISSLLIAEIGGTPTKAGETYAVPISFAFPMLAAIPDFDWSAVGEVTGRMGLDEIDAATSPAVVQILSDRVAPGTIEGAAGEGEASFSENAVALLCSYLDRMEFQYDVDTDAERPVIDLTIKMDNASHQVIIVIDAEKELVYMCLSRYLSAPEDHPNIDAIMQTLMDYNWRLNIGKLEWDTDDGEVRLSYTFTTENGVGFQAFEAILVTLVQTGDNLWPELSELTAVG